jgi:chorismate mutase
MEITQIEQWGLEIPSRKPLIISGPCSAETEEQVMQSCLGAAECGASILRAGIWKPRTRPDSFEGIGAPALPWIKAASLETGLPVCIEVATPTHVEKALKAKIDILWIGARTSVNPFAVQELAGALQGVDIPVMIKNPVNPDLELWIGAIERLYKAGLHKICAIHRGFSVYKSKPYRNLPMWEIPIELRRRIPSLQIICDPSHICGKRDLILDISQKALDLEFDGLMIESHISPEHALSDAAQQLSPADLGEMLNQLVLRDPVPDNPGFLANLEALRVDIDNLDREVIQLLAKRMEVVQEIGKYKKENGVTILQMNRWARIFKSRVDATIEAGLSETFAQAFIQCIHNESIYQQTEVMNTRPK